MCQLKNKIGVNTKDRVNIVEHIFGDNRILKSKGRKKEATDGFQMMTNGNIVKGIAPQTNSFFRLHVYFFL
jgi:hypothetical protein